MDRAFGGTGGQFTVGGQAQSAIEYDASWRAYRQAWKPAGQLRIVGQHSPNADRNRIVPGAQAMGPGARGLASDPLAVPARGRDAAVESRGELQRHQRSIFALLEKEPEIDLPGLIGKDANICLDPSGAKGGKPPAADPLVGILNGNNGAANPGIDERLAAGRGLAMMVAWLETNIGG